MYMLGEKVSAHIYGSVNRFEGTIIDQAMDEGTQRFLVRHDNNGMEVWRDEGQLQALVTIKIPVQVEVERVMVRV